jgi:protocatechuate 4,5-dioxygenase, beta chain
MMSAASGGRGLTMSWRRSSGSISGVGTLDGITRRVSFINKPFDLKFMASMADEPEWAARYSILELVEQTGSQGVELLNWLAARAGVPGAVRKVHSNYHIPISNTAAGMMALAAA